MASIPDASLLLLGGTLVGTIEPPIVASHFAPCSAPPGTGVARRRPADRTKLYTLVTKEQLSAQDIAVRIGCTREQELTA